MEIAVPWLRIVVLGFVVMATGIVFTQSYNTAGDTVMPMVVSLVTIWGIQLPLAIVLSGVGNRWDILGFSVMIPTFSNLGQYGIAWAIVIAMTGFFCMCPISSRTDGSGGKFFDTTVCNGRSLGGYSFTTNTIAGTMKPSGSRSKNYGAALLQQFEQS